jgi:NAD(P)-dependent dehydrogenase (short-subunit alcohol dehydrogenase family)
MAAGGALIYVSSRSGIEGFAEETAYCAAKHALEGFSKCAALEGAPHGILSVTVTPGMYMHTPMSERTYPPELARSGSTRSASPPPSPASPPTARSPSPASASTPGPSPGDRRVTLQPVYDWIDAHADECIADLQTLVRQPSVSAQGIGLRDCATLVRDLMHRDGLPPPSTSSTMARPSSSAT